MSINVTLFGQMITFAIFVFVTMKFVWPHITAAMQARQKKIADGLAAAEQSKHDLALAQRKSVEILREAKQQASQIVDQSNKRAIEIVEEAKENARREGQRLLAHAQANIEQEANNARRDLQKEVGSLALAMAEKILQRDINADAHRDLLNKAVIEV